MEKQRAARYRKTVRRLLIWLCTFLYFSAGWCSAAEPEDAAAALTPVDQTVRCGEDILFTADIPATGPIRMENMDLPEGVSFVSFSRSDVTSSEMEIAVVLRFTAAGRYTLRPFLFTVNSVSFQIPFAPVTVAENPATAVPRMIIKFENGKNAVSGQYYNSPLFSVPSGTALECTVYVQYVQHLFSFSWTAPRDALATEKKRYDAADGMMHDVQFTDDLIPVAVIEWTPLAEGVQYCPDIAVAVESFNGTRMVLESPHVAAAVLQTNTAYRKNTDASSLFASAFTDSDGTGEKKEASVISRADCEKKAAVLSASLHRIRIVCFVFIGAAVVLLVIVLILMILKKRRSALIVFAASCIVVVGGVVCEKMLMKRHAIFTGGPLSVVPELQSGTGAALDAGIEVLIVETAGDWYYIRYGNTAGWVSAETVILIR